MKHWKEPVSNWVHCDGPLGEGYTLCGVSVDGINGDQPWADTFDGIDCPHCVKVITFCRTVRGGQIKPAFMRRKIAAGQQARD